MPRADPGIVALLLTHAGRAGKPWPLPLLRLLFANPRTVSLSPLPSPPPHTAHALAVLHPSPSLRTTCPASCGSNSQGLYLRCPDCRASGAIEVSCPWPPLVPCCLLMDNSAATGLGVRVQALATVPYSHPPCLSGTAVV
jgi:hypothetical protein